MSDGVARRWWAIPLLVILLIGVAVVALALLRRDGPATYRPF